MRNALECCVLLLIAVSQSWAATKVHTVFLGTGKIVPYSAIGDPAGALTTEKQLRVRPLLVDDKIREWTTGESHAITDRSFVVRRALRINDSLPNDKSPDKPESKPDNKLDAMPDTKPDPKPALGPQPSHWVWQ